MRGCASRVGTRTPTTNTLEPLFGVKKSFGITLHNSVNAATESYRLGNSYDKLLHVSPSFFFSPKSYHSPKQFRPHKTQHPGLSQKPSKGLKATKWLR